MNSNEMTGRLLYWTPRILCIAFAAFLGIFAMDVFALPLDPWHKALALLMHLIPTAVVLVALAIVWRWEWIGAVLFPLLAVFHLVTKRGRLDRAGYAMIDGPLLVLGVLFLVNRLGRRRAGLRAG
jgi:hypothetical protein